MIKGISLCRLNRELKIPVFCMKMRKFVKQIFFDYETQ